MKLVSVHQTSARGILPIQRILPIFALIFAIAFFSCSEQPNDDEGTPDNGSGNSSNIQITKEQISGVLQKGPFVKGSSVTIYELNENLVKTGERNYPTTATNDKGTYKAENVELASSYVLLEANGSYRNEVTGEKSASAITINGIADVESKDNVNVNILTHLEYNRVINLVNSGKTFEEAKIQAQKEVLSTFGISGDFENSEDMSIFGTRESDAVLLAISVLLQGDNGAIEFSELLGEFAEAINEKGKWEDNAKKTKIADWASSVNLENIKNNILGWKFSTEVPAFEKYFRNFWNANYALGVCDQKAEGVVKNNANKSSKNKNSNYICQNNIWQIATEFQEDTYEWGACSVAGEIKDGKVSAKKYICENSSWRLATEYEYDTYNWGACSVEGELKAGNVSAKEYICENSAWRLADEYEQDVGGLGACSAEGELKAGLVTDKKYVCKNATWVEAKGAEANLGGCTIEKQGEIAPIGTTYYFCNNKSWRLATEYEYNTYNWEACGAETQGDLKKGNVNDKDYVCENIAWRLASAVEAKLGGCTAEKENIVDNIDSKYYFCENKVWRDATEYEYDTYEWGACATEGALKDGLVSTKKYVCENAVWRLANAIEARLGGCTAAIQDKMLNIGASYYICDKKDWRDATEYEYDTYEWGTCTEENEIRVGDVSNKDYVCRGSGVWEIASYKDVECYLAKGSPRECAYFVDTRNGQRYASVVIGGQTWMAENLNIETMEGSWCYDNNPANCKIYGRLYDWNTAMNGLESSNTNPSNVKGICPAGWHLPSLAEWEELIIYVGGGNINADNYAIVAVKFKARMGDKDKIGWDGTDEYGFSVLPAGDLRPASIGGNFEYGIGSYNFASNLWSATDIGSVGISSESANYYYVHDNVNGRLYSNDKLYGMSVRCVKDN